MPHKDPEKRKEYQKKWREEKKEYMKEYNKQYHLKNKEKRKEYDKQRLQTPQGTKINRISSWKTQGIIFHDYELLYEMYMATYYCDECECELNKCTRSRKCVDHDHSITDKDNFRNILCHSCNTKRG